MTLEERLRRALEVRASGTRTSPDALATIRSRVRRGARRRRGRYAVLAGLATAAVAAVSVLVLSPGSGAPVGITTTSARPSSAPPLTISTMPSTTPPPSTTTSAAPPGSVSEPVYLAGAGGLYREFHRVAGGELTERIAAALTDMISGTPLDPDYRTLWPPGSAVRSVAIDAGTVVVDVAVAPVAPDDPGLAVQELVYTVTAVAAQAGRGDLDRVRLTTDSLWGLDTSTALRRAPHTEVVAPVWLATPQQGATVGRTFTVRLVGTVFEAAAVLRVRDASGAVVRERPVSSTRAPRLAAAPISS